MYKRQALGTTGSGGGGSMVPNESREPLAPSATTQVKIITQDGGQPDQEEMSSCGGSRGIGMKNVSAEKERKDQLK